MDAAATRLNVTARAPNRRGVDVRRVQFAAPQEIVECCTYRPGTTAKVDDDGSGFGDHRRHPHDELRATARHEDARFHGDARPAEIRPPHNMF